MKKKFTKILGVGLTLALLTSLMVAAVPVLANVSQPTVDIGTGTKDDISANTTYKITFYVNEEIPNDADGWIEVRFPDDTSVGTFGTDNVTVQTVSDWGNDNSKTSIPTANITVTEEDDIYTVQVSTDALTYAIAEDSRVRLILGGDVIINPSAPDEYTLEVRTSDETNWVESEIYEVKIPTLETLPGVVSLYNPSDILMGTYTGDSAIQDAIDAAGADFTIKVGEGEYDDTIDINEDVVVMSVGAMTSTKIDGLVTMSHDDATLDGIRIDDAVTVTADDITIKNCQFDEDDPTSLIIATGADDVTIDNCTFDVTDDTSKGIDVQAGDVVIKNCTFEVEEDTIAIVIASETDVENCTITGGADGTGIKITAAVAVSIEGNTLDALDIAINTDNGTLDISGNTITNSETVGIDVANGANGRVIIYQNTINDNDEGVQVNDGSDNVTIMFNSFSGNDDHIDENDATAGIKLNASNNYWGSADGPASGTIEGDVIYEPWLGSLASNGEIATDDDELDAKDTVGVIVSADAAVDMIAVANYAANPQAATADPANLFIDVYVLDAAAAATEVNIRIYADVTEATTAYVWGAVQGDWVEASDQGVSLYGGYVWVTVEDDDTVPTIEDLSGTVIALTEPAVSGPSVTLLSPAIGAYDVPIQPMFTWTAAAGVIGYEVVLAEDPTFTIPEWSYNADGTYFKADDVLDYSTTYYWRVRGVTAEPYVVGKNWVIPSGPWATGIFTTEAEPVAAVEEEPDITVETPTVTVNPPSVTVKPAEAAVPDYILWTIVGIGAVLIVALIVLIVRTRRVA